MSHQRTFYLSGCDINYKETDSDGNVAVTGFVATLQAGDHDFTPPTKAFELGLDLITKANTHGDMLAALKAAHKLLTTEYFESSDALMERCAEIGAVCEAVISKTEAQ